VVPTDTYADEVYKDNRCMATQYEAMEDRAPPPSPCRSPDTPPADGSVGRYTAPRDVYGGVRVPVSHMVTSGAVVAG
jgi:hypothetical protein